MEIKHIHQRLGVTVVRDPRPGRGADRPTAWRYSTQGEIQQIAPPRDLYEAPCNNFVAHFIGRNNAWPATGQPDGSVAPGHRQAWRTGRGAGGEGRAPGQRRSACRSVPSGVRINGASESCENVSAAGWPSSSTWATTCAFAWRSAATGRNFFRQTADRRARPRPGRGRRGAARLARGARKGRWTPDRRVTAPGITNPAQWKTTMSNFRSIFRRPPWPSASRRGQAMAADLTVISFGGANRKPDQGLLPAVEAAGKGKVIAGEYNGEMAKVKAMVDTNSVSWHLVEVESPTDPWLRRGPVRGARPGPVRQPDDFIGAPSSLAAWASSSGPRCSAYNADKLSAAPASWADFWDVAKFPASVACARAPSTPWNSP